MYLLLYINYIVHYINIYYFTIINGERLIVKTTKGPEPRGGPQVPVQQGSPLKAQPHTHKHALTSQPKEGGEACVMKGQNKYLRHLSCIFSILQFLPWKQGCKTRPFWLEHTILQKAFKEHNFRAGFAVKPLQGKQTATRSACLYFSTAGLGGKREGSIE